MMKLEHYLLLPWTIEKQTMHDDGEYHALTIEELPEFLVAARTEEELERRFWPALTAYIESFLSEGRPLPIPQSLLESPVGRGFIIEGGGEGTSANTGRTDEISIPEGAGLATSARPACRRW